MSALAHGRLVRGFRTLSAATKFWSDVRIPANFVQSSRLRKSPYFEQTIEAGATEFTSYNRMLMVQCKSPTKTELQCKSPTKTELQCKSPTKTELFNYVAFACTKSCRCNITLAFPQRLWRARSALYYIYHIPPMATIAVKLRRWYD